MLRGVLRGVAPLIAMPLLQACRRAWADPAPASLVARLLPDLRGVARARRDPRTRRGPASPVSGLWRGLGDRVAPLPFCGEHDHTRLGSLVASEGLEREKIEVCDACHGYLRPSRPSGRSRPSRWCCKTPPPWGSTWPRWSAGTGPRTPGAHWRSGSSPGAPDSAAWPPPPRRSSGLRSPRNRSWRHRGWSPVAPLQRGEVFAWAGELSRRAAATSAGWTSGALLPQLERSWLTIRRHFRSSTAGRNAHHCPDHAADRLAVEPVQHRLHVLGRILRLHGRAPSERGNTPGRPWPVSWWHAEQ